MSELTGEDPAADAAEAKRDAAAAARAVKELRRSLNEMLHKV